ncbi:MAG: hypothetical protein GXP55_20955 [Deltaproteobacteria bacterium]|nr:hypothetical protein [Deltaproteobacteria bacterium]
MASVYALLSIPEGPVPTPSGVDGVPFQWAQHGGDASLFQALEARYESTRARGCAESSIDSNLGMLDAILSGLAAEPGRVEVDDARLDSLFRYISKLGADVAACPARASDFVERARRLRRVVKDLSTRWDMSSRSVRDTLYRLLYGTRAAVEEVLLAAPEGTLPAIQPGTDEPSSAPSALVHGVRVHSGDLLLSRGGAPTSAMIARGNDYPGNFSHVALVHVDEAGVVSVIESHIERGVVVSSLEEYLADEKLRLMVLRPRADLPALQARPQLPAEAANDALRGARASHIPYDFEMDYEDHSAQFCSEVASAAYEGRGVQLWQGLTSTSQPGVARWLASFGVTHFVTYGPSDLEYDPQLRVVAEWRARDKLLKDHVDNAIVDVMLEGAAAGEDVGYDRDQLPLARLAKGWSSLLVLLGRVGPVPEGMSATVALRVESLRSKYAEVRGALLERVATYERREGHAPPYWRLLEQARDVRTATRR